MRKRVSIWFFLAVPSAFCFNEVEESLPEEGIFQKELLRYLKREKEKIDRELHDYYGTDLSKNIVEFVNRLLQHQAVEERAISYIQKAEKFNHLGKLIEQLSKIIILNSWIYQRKYENKEYIKRWNDSCSKEKRIFGCKQKQVPDMIKVLAVDKETSMQSNFYLDLKGINCPLGRDSIRAVVTLIRYKTIPGFCKIEKEYGHKVVYKETDGSIKTICYLMNDSLDKDHDQAGESFKKID